MNRNLVKFMGCQRSAALEPALAGESPAATHNNTRRRRYSNPKRAILVYRAPPRIGWLWYRKNSRAVIVPNSSDRIAANFSCKR